MSSMANGTLAMNIDIVLKNNKFRHGFPVLVLIYLIDILTKIKSTGYKYINLPLLTKNISPYIHYYNNNTSDNIYGDQYNGMYPNVIHFTGTVQYTEYQLEKWIKLTQECLDIKTIKELEITDPKRIMYYSEQLDQSSYLKHGVAIGNLSHNKEFSPKFHKILKAAHGKRAAFYSSFLKSGILLFKKFLEINKINHLYLDVDLTSEEKDNILKKFKDSTIFLLLHPKYYEGITILGAEQLHIIEPMMDTAKKEQLIARVVRYKSHDHLSPSKRYVEIYQWICSMKSILSNLRKYHMSILKWFELNKEVFYMSKYNKFDQNKTPDQAVIDLEKSNMYIEKGIISNLKKYNKIVDKSCCIQMPSNKQYDKCIKERGKQC
jgi:hypothetical protein